MFFGAFEDAIENALDIGTALITFGEEGEINRKNIAKLMADGIEIAAIASMMGVAEDTFEEWLMEENETNS